MTEQTATDLLSYLVTTFLNNGFSDIGTFLLPEYGAENQYEQNTSAYQYRDSSTALQDLLADRTVRPKEALSRLLAAAREYFAQATGIPAAYAGVIATFDSTNRSPIDTTIRLLGRDEESVTNVTTVLENSQIRQMRRLLGILAERINEEDDSFLNDLDEL